jgi:hypothetical protein
MTRTLAFALFLLPLTASLASAADLTLTISDVHSSTRRAARPCPTVPTKMALIPPVIAIELFEAQRDSWGRTLADPWRVVSMTTVN